MVEVKREMKCNQIIKRGARGEDEVKDFSS